MSPSRDSIFMFISNFHSHPEGQGGSRIKSPVRGQGCQGEELSGVNRQMKTAGKIAGREKGAHYLLTQTRMSFLSVHQHGPQGLEDHPWNLTSCSVTAAEKRLEYGNHAGNCL